MKKGYQVILPEIKVPFLNSGMPYSRANRNTIHNTKPTKDIVIEKAPLTDNDMTIEKNINAYIEQKLQKAHKFGVNNLTEASTKSNSSMGNSYKQAKVGMKTQIARGNSFRKRPSNAIKSSLKEIKEEGSKQENRRIKSGKRRIAKSTLKPNY